MTRLHNPTTDQTFHISQVTKAQLAQAVNTQAQRLRQLDAHVKVLTKLVLAIVREPEAFKVDAVGTVTIDKGAVSKAVNGDELHVQELEHVFELSVTSAVAAAPSLELPTIVGPVS